MPFSDTTGKAGIIQTIEFWTSIGDGGISGNATLLKIFTGLTNGAYDRLMPLLLSYSNKLRWDDVNHTDLPVGTISIVSGQADYTITQDDNSLDILNITDVRIFESSSSTEYVTLKEMTIDDPRALDAMSPNPTNTGIPTIFLKRGNTIHLYLEPNYSATNGLKIFFEREQSYFISTDTTKEAGIPRPFQGLLPLYAAYDWLLVNKPVNNILITHIESQIEKREQSLRDIISFRNPIRNRIGVNQDSNK